jgi:hypothetical protein
MLYTAKLSSSYWHIEEEEVEEEEEEKATHS